VNRGRVLVSIPNRRIKPKRQPVIKPEVVDDDNSKNTESLENGQSSGSESASQERQIEGGFHAPERDDSEMTAYIIPTLNSQSDTASVGNHSKPSDVVADQSSRIGIDLKKSSDTEVLLQAMGLRENPNVNHNQSDNRPMTGELLNLKEEQNPDDAEISRAMHTVNETPANEVGTEVTEPAKKRRGRPPGSKNKTSKSNE
jgi:hypothetical protein